MCLFRFQHSRGGHLLPHDPITIVKLILEDWAYRKASIPDYNNVEKIEAIMSM